jgi:hypothetical protein
LSSCNRRIVFNYPIDTTIDTSNNNDGETTKNVGEECWWTCGQKNGNCSWCGAEGMCCRLGSKWIVGGCDGNVGGANRHECTKKPE